MAPQATYGGPTALGSSKYASPSSRRAQIAIFPAAVFSTENTTIATREQIAASHDESAVDVAAQNSDAHLAIAQGNALNEEVDKHAAQFSRTVSSAVTNTRRLLELIREAVQKEDPTALKSVDDLWTELELLFQAAQGSKEALPTFLEKQRNNMALYHASAMNETYRESQEELNMQNKKARTFILSILKVLMYGQVNLQHGLILEHQQAFQDYKAQTASKLKDLEDLQERVSRLTLEKGNFRGEIEKYVQLLEQEQTTKAEDLKKAEALQKELDSLVATKKQLLAEIEVLEKTVSNLEENMQTTEQQLTNRFTAELKEKIDLLSKETANSTGLNTLINNLKGQESNVKMEMAKVKAESKLMTDKYNRMATEHSQAFSKTNEQTKKIESLIADAERLRKESADVKAHLAKLPELEKNNSSLFKDKSDLLTQIGKLSIELGDVKNTCVKVNKELASLTVKLDKVQNDNEALKVENSHLLSKQADMIAEDRKVAQQIQTASEVEQENTKLKALINQLKVNEAAPAVGGAVNNKDQAAMQAQVRALEDQKEKLQIALNEWTALAKRSYKEFKDMLPTYKQAKKFRTAAMDAEDQIATLRRDLSAARASQSNGVSADGDAAYWKKKYDGLLATVGN